MKSHAPRKRFGQNFLQDRAVIQKICHVVQPRSGENLVEIGPGQGALTVELLKQAGKLTVIELDRDLIEPLQQHCAGLGELTVYQQDVLTVDWQDLANAQQKLRLVGNLPYNITTPLLFHCFQQIELIYDMHFMVQLEVAERLAAQPGSKTYGRLSVMAQYFCQVNKLFNVPAAAFYPQPKVTSAVVRLVPFQQRDIVAKDLQVFAEVVRVAFTQRRKTLTNVLKNYLSATALQSLDIEPTLRPENLTVADFVRIGNYIAEQ